MDIRSRTTWTRPRPERNVYLDSIGAAGFTVDQLRLNAHEFISGQARNASATYGVKSISWLATRAAAQIIPPPVRADRRRGCAARRPRPRRR
ncbi:hypothetical protein GCM10027200_52790 [Lentzea nigeriaca]